MFTLFYDKWQFLELSLDNNQSVVEDEKILSTFTSSDFEIESVENKWQLFHTSQISENSIAFFKKNINILENQDNQSLKIHFSGLFSSYSIWINNTKIISSTEQSDHFEFDLSGNITEGSNDIFIAIVFQKSNNFICNSETFRALWTTSSRNSSSTFETYNFIQDKSKNIVENQLVIKPKTFFQNGHKILHLGNFFIINIEIADSNNCSILNAHNYITFNVTGKAELIGLDNGDCVDSDDFRSDNNASWSRMIYKGKLTAIIYAKNPKPSFVLTAASETFDNVSIKFDGEKWGNAAPYWSIHPVYDFIPENITPETQQFFPSYQFFSKINWEPIELN